MHAEIIATGDEIRSGALVDSNSAHIAQQIELMGIEVTRHHSVGDDLDTLIQLFREVGSRAEIAVCTGGLGPTMDDLTSEAAAKATGVELVLDESALKTIQAMFAFMGRQMSDSNKKQAYFPAGAERLDNPVGTAPGFAHTIGKCRFFFMPGVPHEMRKMLAEKVVPRIEQLRGGKRQYSLVKTIGTFGSTESQIGEKISDLPQKFPGIKVGTRAKFPEIQVKLYVRGADETAAVKLLDAAVNEALSRLANWAFCDDGGSMAETVGQLLQMEKASLAVAESCTGGLIADWITDIPGASDYFRLSAVTYSNDAKHRVLGVSTTTLERYGAVHEETAKEMAAGARAAGNATYAISTSGIAGPGGGSENKPVGTVCIGIATPAGAEGHRFVFPFRERDRNKQIFATTALDLLRRRLMGLPPPKFGMIPKRS